MSKSVLYTANTSSQEVLADGIINPGTIVRKFGCNIGLNGNAIILNGPGYYDIDASITLAPTAVGDVTVTVYKDNVPVQGATASETAAAVGDSINLSISSIVRENCQCCEGLSNLTFVLTGEDSTVTNVAIAVEKL
jgi:hypothetical protein